MIIHVNYTLVSPYAITFIMSYVAGAAVSYGIMIKCDVNKTLASLASLVTLPTSLLCAYGLCYITTGERGFASIGGAIGLLLSVLVLILIFKEYKYGLCTAYITILPLMYSFSKIGCTLVGCCYGVPYDGPFNVSYTGRVNISHVFPIQFMEVIVFFLLFLVAIFKKNNLLTLLLCIFAKFLLDFLRHSHLTRIISLNQIFCAVILILICVLKKVLRDR